MLFGNCSASIVLPSLRRESGFRGRTALRGLPRTERGEVRDLARSPQASRAVRRTSSAASTRIRATATATHTRRSRTSRRVGPFRAGNPPEQAVTLARKMRGASIRGGLPAAAVRRDHPVAALRLPDALTLPGPARAGSVPSRSAFFRRAQAGLRREMARSASV
jgi:hypothetical protein